jgi:abortive infection bacteriophage resistance protein
MAAKIQQKSQKMQFQCDLRQTDADKLTFLIALHSIMHFLNLESKYSTLSTQNRLKIAK